MRKRRILTAAATLAAVAGMAGAAAAHGNDQSDARATVGRAHVTIHYGRPELKGRDPLKMIEPGQAWRMGADVPTTLETDGDLDFGGTRVAKGRYFLMAMLVQEGQWTLVVSRQPVSHYEPGAKVAEIPLEFSKGDAPSEEMTIRLAGRGPRGQIEIRWGTMKLEGEFRAAR